MKKRHFQAQKAKNSPKNAISRHFSVIFTPKTFKTAYLVGAEKVHISLQCS